MFFWMLLCCYYYHYMHSFVLSFLFFFNFCDAFCNTKYIMLFFSDGLISRIWLMEPIWLWKQNSLLPPPYFNLLLPPSSLRLSIVLCSPLPHSHAKWMAQMLLDKTVVPLGPVPLTIHSAWGPKLVFWSLFPPQPLPPLRANRHAVRGEMGQPRATKSEGRGQRSAKPCFGNMKKTYC